MKAASPRLRVVDPSPSRRLALREAGVAPDLRLKANQLRGLVIDVAYQAHVGHIASCLSIVDSIVATLSVLDLDRDTFILSKGHAALALFGGLYQKGLISRDDLFSYCADDSRFGVHPDHRVPGIRFTTGSLGYGLGFAAGVSLARQVARAPGECVALLSDAELNEGSTWEAIMFAGHHHLPLVAIIDVNGQQALGKTRSVLDLQPLAEKFVAFGWQTDEVDGHDPAALRGCVQDSARSGPRVVLAQTVAGHGVPFMEGRVEWHYLPLTEVQYVEAKRALRAAVP